MPQRLIYTYELFSKAFPWIVGATVNAIGFTDAILRVGITCVSMLAGALFVHYLKPIIVKKINRLKKN